MRRGSQATRFKGEYTRHEEEQPATFGESLHFFAAVGVDNVIVYTFARHDFLHAPDTSNCHLHCNSQQGAMIVNS
jgi:hypothetical protein